MQKDAKGIRTAKMTAQVHANARFGHAAFPTSRDRPWKLAKAIGRLIGVSMPIAVRVEIRQDVKTTRVAAAPAMTNPTVPTV
jgi:hypothetical protein